MVVCNKKEPPVDTHTNMDESEMHQAKVSDCQRLWVGEEFDYKE